MPMDSLYSLSVDYPSSCFPSIVYIFSSRSMFIHALKTHSRPLKTLAMASEVGSSSHQVSRGVEDEEEEAELSWADSCLINNGCSDTEISTAHHESTLLSTAISGTEGLSSPPSHVEDEEEFQVSTISPFRDSVNGKENAVFRPWDSADDEDSASALQSAEEEKNNIFRVWDLNSENPELETDSFTAILTSSLAQSDQNPLVADSDLDIMPPPSVHAFDLKDLSSALEESDNLEGLISGMADLNISVTPRGRTG
eukprot:Gb_12916 [translate_table: standard]